MQFTRSRAAHTFPSLVLQLRRAAVCLQGVDSERVLFSVADFIRTLNDIYINAWCVSVTDCLSGGRARDTLHRRDTTNRS